MNITGKYLKVWEVKKQNGYTSVNLGDSYRMKDGNYENFTWFDCTLLGNASRELIEKFDTVEVISGIMYMEKYNGKYYNRIKIFDLKVTKKHEQNNRPDPNQFESDIPF